MPNPEAPLTRPDTFSPEKFVAYYRVSTEKQGRSGLGLEAQKDYVSRYLRQVNGQQIAEFTEIESGKNTQRPQLARALAMARGRHAVLIVAKLDRLARNVAFVSKLLDTPGVEFRAADFPSANRFMIHILSAFAEYERTLISERTKSALAARKARGLSVGTIANLRRGNAPGKSGGVGSDGVGSENTNVPRPTPHAPLSNGQEARALAEAMRMKPVLDVLKEQGIASIRAICKALNEQGYRTERGKEFYPATVRRMLHRCEGPPRQV